MKNTLKVFATVAIASMMITSNANAKAISKSTNIGASTSTSFIDGGGKNNDASSTISTRALRNFQKAFNGVTNAEWSKTIDGGYIAQFCEDNIETVVAYNGKGSWNHTIRYYQEKKLPFEIRDMVKRSYYDYTISLVTEVKVDLQTVYFVYLQDESHLKIIRVYDNEMQETGSYKKG